MARAGGTPSAGAGPRDFAGDRRARTARAAWRAHTGWRSLAGLGLGAFFGFLSAAQAQVVSTRIWPAEDYTRVTLESRSELHYTLFTVRGPERLVLDLEDVALNAALAGLGGEVAANDPYIEGIRIARNRPHVVRVVLDLKQVVSAQAFALQPVGNYGHRLVLDLYPLVPPDPLAQLIEQSEKRARAPREGESAPAPVPPRAAPSVARLATIVIDPGHGGEDPGAIGRHGSREKDITLLIARRLKALIDAQPDMRALLTRDGDYFLPLQARVAKARKVRADLLVSIHADAFVRPYARGSSVFALSVRRATSEAARWLARRENEADLIGGVNLDLKDRYLARTLLDLSQTATIDHSLRLGRTVLDELGQINTLHKGRVEQASFAVLKAPDVPSILVETAFISNPSEERRLNDEAYQNKLAQAILAGIRRYLEKNAPRPGAPLALN